MPKRKATIIRSKGTKHIAIDDENKSEIQDFLKSNPVYQDKFQQIIEIILDNLKVPALFDKEDIDSKSKDVWAMKFLKTGDNSRIYCKEVRTKENGQYIIVAVSVLPKKKNQKNKAAEKSLIHQVSAYDYEVAFKTTDLPKKEHGK